MRLGNAKFAYDIARVHHLTEGSHFADLEWLAGYISLRKLNDPFAAISHFKNFQGAVASPISLGRAGYWLGRAYEAQGNQAQAQREYAEGAKHQTSFYGQLSAERLGQPMDPALVGRATAPDWRNAAFTQSSVFRAGALLLEAGELSLSERFLRHLAETQNPRALAQLGRFAIEAGEPHLAVMLGKQAVTEGTVLPGPYYALHPMAQSDLGVPKELALAIARRESEFDPRVVSGVGARGLMQLMPGTAKEMAGDLGLSYSSNRLLSDWQYNATLGGAYLRELTAEFGASPVLIAAAYNAGPSRARAWIQSNGDPRSGKIDVVDWIEHIPFRETRNYVMRVTESLPIYRARIAGRTLPIGLNKDLIGAMPGQGAAAATASFVVTAAPSRSLRPVARVTR
jgi:soluble lytic murein transglycosylase